MLVLFVLFMSAPAVANTGAAGETFQPGKGLDLSSSFTAQRDAIFKALDDGTEVALVYRERGGWDLVSADAVLRTPVGEWVWSSPAPVPGTTIPWAARTWF